MIPRPIDSIFHEALVKSSPEERDMFLNEACHGDRELRQRIERLLAAHPQADSELLEAQLTGVVEHANVFRSDSTAGIDELTSGTQIGAFKLLQKIGEGGFGIVYLAEQQQPIARRVALKIIRPGMDTEQVIARFEAERQALAMMDHPHIAKVYEAGATTTGRPYFAMELVQGMSITEYCFEHNLHLRQRLRLFAQVCQAVQHAHQKGIIHRDLKPQNILVSEDNKQPTPKVIDFGIAKAVNQRLTEKAIFTQLGQFIGTPEYMSPEQAGVNHLDVDTRSDIYSLGVILYELLTGETPLQRERLRSAAYEEMIRMIREEEPPKPSTRITSLGKSTATRIKSDLSRQRLWRQVKGDLDWIAMKALEKDRSRRYETADAFALDIMRYLNEEPILARPPSSAYRLRKFARRHRITLRLVGVLLVLCTIFAIAAGIAWSNIRARHAEVTALRIVEDLMRTPAPSLAVRIQQVRETPGTARILQEYVQRNPAHIRDDNRSLYAQLVLADQRPGYLQFLQDSLLKQEPELVQAMLQVLQPEQSTLEQAYWDVMRSDRYTVGQRFRAGVALAWYAPRSERWQDTDVRFLARQLMEASPDSQGVWRDLLHPLAHTESSRTSFLAELEQAFESTSPKVLLNSAYALIEYLGEDFELLARQLSRANRDQFDVLFDVVQVNPHPRCILALQAITALQPSADTSSSDRVVLGRERANAAIALMRLGHHAAILPVFEFDVDPEAMTQWLHRSAPFGVSVDDVLACWEVLTKNEPDNDRIRYALTRALSEYRADDVPKAHRERIVASLRQQYRDHRSSGVHSATGWLLRHWDQEEFVRQVDQSEIPYSPDREWFTLKIPFNTPGEASYLTFIVFQPGSFTMGSPQHEEGRDTKGPENRRTVLIERPFAILDREVTYQELMAFDPKSAAVLQMFSPPKTTDGAGPGTSWYDAVRFCRWLSQQHGIGEEGQAYPHEKTLDVNQYPHDPICRWAPGNWPMRSDQFGFRLPSEAEWEYACRSGTGTPFSFGGDKDLLEHYAWFAGNSAKRVHAPKTRQPNPRGLFDVHGNLFEWCHDHVGTFPAESPDDSEPIRLPTRILKGGCWGVLSEFLRSANKISFQPSANFVFLGIRPCMTLPSGSD